MWDLLKPYYVDLLKIAWNDGTDTVGEVVGAFDLENEYVQTVLKDLAKRVKGVEDTTREEIQNVIGQMGREGLSVDQAQARLLEMAEINSASRAEAIARTESAHGYSAGSMAYYKESGVVGGVEWLTSDPCPICAPLSGTVAELGKQFAGGFDHPPAHPNCRCAVAPILKEGEPKPGQDPKPEPTLEDAQNVVDQAENGDVFAGSYEELFDVVPREAYRKYVALLDDDKYESVPIKLDNLIAETDQGWDAERVLKFAQEDIDPKRAPAVLRYNGNNYLQDGHHRALSRLLLGEDSVITRLVDVSDK